MIPTFLIDAPLMVLIGMLYAPLAGKTAAPFYRSKVFFASLRLAIVFLALVAAGYAVAPEWMWMYYVRPEQVSIAALPYVALVFYFFPYLAGLWLGQHIAAAGKRAWITGLCACLFLEALMVIGWWPRYSKVGTMEQFIAGTAPPLAAPHALNLLLSAGTVLLLALAGGQWWWLRQQDKSKERTQVNVTSADLSGGR